jgi:hypothetical protein
MGVGRAAAREAEKAVSARAVAMEVLAATVWR